MFHTLANIDTDKILLNRIAIVDTQPAPLSHFFGKEILITKANKGINTAANVKWMVRVSMDCKKFSNVIV